MMKLVRLLAVFVFTCIILQYSAYADISFTAPVANTRVKSCDDFATAVLNNPWDMSDTADVNNFFPGLDVQGFSNASIANGVFSGVTFNTGASFQLLSPYACGGYPVGGRYGSDVGLDTSKYSRLTIRMYVDKADPFGLRMTWNRGCNYATDRTVTVPFPTKVGWHTYTIDLNTIGIEATGNTNPWSAGTINGFAILPSTLSGTTVQVDYIRLEDPASCGSTSINYNASADGNDNLYSVWLDTDTNPFNGYIKHLVAGESTAGVDSETLSSLGANPGSYKVIGLVDADYRTLTASDPWDMSDATDILLTSGISVSTNAGSPHSVFEGATTSGDSTIYLRVPSGGIDASKFSKLSLKISRSSDTNMALFWGSGSYLIPAGSSVGGDRYEIDLAGMGGWSGTITELILRPANTAGVSFSLDFVALRSAGFATSLDSTTLATGVVAAGGDVQINNPPSVEFVRPNNKGGEAIQPWNMVSGDLRQFGNLRGDSDPNFPGETYSLYLPDVRVIDGLRGDFFKGTNLEGSDDPVNFSSYLGAPVTFDASKYKNLCFKLYVATAFDLGLGSVGRVLWLIDGQPAFTTSEDIVLIYDGWSGTQWYEYCVDMTKLWVDGTTSSNWFGNISNFRVDGHEFRNSTSFYFDYIKLRKDAESKGVFNIVVEHSDPDDTANVDLYYTTAAGPSGGTLIGTLPAGQVSYAWNTAGVPAGSYLLYAVANDGRNTTTRAAKGRITVSNTGISGAAPALSLETPSEGLNVCNSLQVKGYAVQPDRFEDVSVIEVHVDSALLGVTYPGLFSNAAKAAYPSADSSNAGFNKTFDISNYGAGAHTVTVKAVSADGTATTQSFNVTKGNTNCPAEITDPAPAGSPEVIPNVELPELPTPNLAVKQTKAGDITLTVKQLTDTTCTIRLYAGETSDNVGTQVGFAAVAPAHIKKTSMSFQAKKVKINKKKVKEIYFAAQKECPGYKTGSSAARRLKVASAKGISTASAAITTISKKLKLAAVKNKGGKKKGGKKKGGKKKKK